MDFRDFLPESRYSLSTLNDSFGVHSLIGKVIHVRPTKIDYLEKAVTVFIDEAHSGLIPFEELSIYSDTCIEEFYWFIVRGSIITAEIIDYDNSRNTFILSRKKNMERALEYFKSDSCPIVYAYKTGASHFFVYLDIGAGIKGLLSANNISISYVTDASKYFYDLNYIPVKILFENKPGKFILSHKDAIDLKEVSVGDILVGRIANSLPDHTGLFVEFSANLAGILNVSNLEIIEVDGKTLYLITDRPGKPGTYLEQDKNYQFIVKTVKCNGSHLKITLL